MTYTFKLARRLAVSREYLMLPLIAVLVACSGENTAPSGTLDPNPASILGLRVVPSVVTLETQQQVRFRGEGRDVRGRRLSLPMDWEASGGVIDAQGTFSAAVAGTYKVVGRGRGRQKSDTSVVIVVPPQLNVVEVVLIPDTITLDTSATRTFAASGLLSDGTSAAIGVTWKATGGSIDAGGLYTAGPTPGTYKVIATKVDTALADTASVTIAAPTSGTSSSDQPSVSPSGKGVPFGPSQMPITLTTPLFTLRHVAVSASNILTRIDEARTGNYELLLNMTGGDHSNYMSVIGGVYQFDRSKWEAKMNTFNTSAIRQAVAAAVSDGVIIGNSVMDEPQVCGGGDGNTWGPCGTMTKARVDSLCGYVHRIFPTLAVGVAHNHKAFEPDKDYQVCEFDITQYATRLGSVTTFRDGALAIAKRSGTKVVFSINLLNGGVQDKDGTWDCTGEGQAGKGTYSPNCRMTPQQVQDYGLVLGPAGCAFKMWRYDADFMSNQGNLQAFKTVAEKLATIPRTGCKRQ